MGLSSKNINQRFFGSDIRPAVKQKLALRQQFSKDSDVHGALKSVRDMYGPIVLDDYASDFGGNNEVSHEVRMADMSSRTPFVRMWTAVQLFTAKPVDIKANWGRASLRSGAASGEFNSKAESSTYLKANPRHWWDDKRDPYIRIWEKDIIASKIYEIGLNTMGQTHNMFNEVDNSTGTTVGDSGATIDDVFPTELQDNKFLKPQAGITSVSSRNEDFYGYLKTTTISFVVYNFLDYQNIYMRYFLKPGALIFVDFGWSTANLYKTDCVMFDIDCPDRLSGKSIEEKLYGEEGFVTEHEGDMETVHGTVSNWSSKLNSAGAYECTIEIISRGSTLVSGGIDSEDQLKRKIINKFDTLLIQTTYDDLNYVDPEDPTKTINFWEYASTSNNPDVTALAIVSKYLSFDKNQFPCDNSLFSGIYWNRRGKINDSKSIWVQWGLFEDTILSGNILNVVKTDPGQLGPEWNSQNTFVTYSVPLAQRQLSSDDLYLSGKFLYPHEWGVKDVYNMRAGKYPTAYDLDSLKNSGLSYTEYDKSERRVPFREIFINLHLIKTAFRKNQSTKAAVSEILQELNESSENIFDLMLSNCLCGGGGNTLSVIDKNVPLIDTFTETEDSSIRSLFMFKPFSPGSLVLNFNYEFKAPSSDYLAMLAITGMNPLDNSLYPGAKSLDTYLNMNKFEHEGMGDYGVTFLPDTMDNLQNMDVDLETMPTILTNLQSDSGFTSLVLDGSSIRINQILDAEAASLCQINLGELANIEGDLKTNNFVTGDNEELYPSVILESHDNPAKSKEDKPRIAKNEVDYWSIIARITDKVERTASLLPIEASLSIYGIATIESGDVCRIDFLPAAYRTNTYWQVGRVTHDISPSMWKTDLELLLKYKSTTAVEALTLNQKIVLDKGYVAKFQLKEWKIYGDYIQNIQPFIFNRDDYPGVKKMFTFNWSEAHFIDMKPFRIKGTFGWIHRLELAAKKLNIASVAELTAGSTISFAGAGSTGGQVYAAARDMGLTEAQIVGDDSEYLVGFDKWVLKNSKTWLKAEDANPTKTQHNKKIAEEVASVDYFSQRPEDWSKYFDQDQVRYKLDINLEKQYLLVILDNQYSTSWLVDEIDSDVKAHASAIYSLLIEKAIIGLHAPLQWRLNTEKFRPAIVKPRAVELEEMIKWQSKGIIPG